MAVAKTSFSMSRMVKGLTIEIKLVDVKRATRRIRAAMVIMRFAMWVGGFGGVKFVDGDD